MALSALEQRVRDSIEARRDALVLDLRTLVDIPTGSGYHQGLDETRERLTSRLHSLGASVELIAGSPRPDWLYGAAADPRIPPTAVCRHAEGREGTRILLSGHLDTVHPPTSDFRRLTIDADGRRATGPGCVDMKGGLAIAVNALEALEEAGAGVAWSFILNSDEETGSYHSESALRAEAARHDVGLVFEPALPGGELVTERMGSGQFMIEAFGRSAHVGRDFTRGVSAVTALAERIVAAARLADPARELILNIGPLQGGTATNVVPDHARAWGNVRFPNPSSADELGRMIDALATDPQSADALPRVVVHRSFNRPAKPITPQTERLALAARGVAEDLGRKLPFAKTGGVCDGNILQDAGLPTIDTLGVRGGGLHTVQEWIELPSLVERCTLTAILMLRLSRGPA